MKTPSLIIIHGPSASGKSTVAELVKTQIKPSVHLGSDRLRFHITDFRIDNKKENFDITRDIMMGMVRDYLKKGFSVVVEDQLRDEHVETLLEISRELEVSCNIYETSATREALLERITERRVAQGELDDIDMEWVNWQYKDYLDNRYANSVVFDTGKVNPKMITEKILEDIK